MQEIVEKLTNDKLATANDLETLKGKFSKLEKQFQDSQNIDNESLVVENESLKVQLNKMIAENKVLIEDLANLEKKYVREISSSTHSESQEIQAKISEIEKLSSALKVTKDLADDQVKTIEFLQAELTIKNDEVQLLETDLQKVKDEYHKYQSKREENDVEKFEAEEQVALLEDQIQEQVQTIKAQEEKIAELTVLVEGLKNSPSEEEANKLQTQVAILTDRIAILETESTSNTEIIERLKQENSDIENRYEELLRSENQKSDESEIIKAELEKYKELSKVLQNQLDDCCEIRSAKTKECEELK